MAAAAFGRARNYGLDGRFNRISIRVMCTVIVHTELSSRISCVAFNASVLKRLLKYRV